MLNPFTRIDFSKDGLVKEYRKYLKEAHKQCNKGNLEKSLRCLYYSTMVEWLYPIGFYIDEETESLLDQIAKRILPERNFLPNTHKKRAVFYNGQLIDSGALTEQYLNYLIDHDYEVLFIVFGKERCAHGLNILKRVNSLSNFKVLIPENASYVDRIIDIYHAIIEFNPSVAFLHFLPNDIIGYCAFTRLNQIPRYYIVHNDHTFWLGKNCSDVFLEFRAFGRKLSIERRGIEESQIRLLPYYPIVQDVPFQGFPCDVTGKVVGLSGAMLYKYTMDSNLTYFHAIKKLLQENDNFVFFLAGGGNVQEIETVKNFIKNEGLEDRFYYIGHRKDFYNLIGNIDILFESYPFNGGLTLLYATNQRKAIVGIARMDALSGSTDELLDLVDYWQPRNFEEFHKEATKLIRDSAYRAYIGEIVANNQSTKKCFDRNLTEILENRSQLILKRSYELHMNDEKILQDYLNLKGYRFTLYNNKYNIVHTSLFAQIVRTLWSLKFNGFYFTWNTIKRKILHSIPS